MAAPFNIKIDCSNFIAFSRSELDAFLRLDCEKLETFLLDENLVVKTEREAFEALQQWVLHSPTERLAEVPKLLPLIRLNQLEPNYLASTVNNLAVKAGCASLIESAIHRQSLRCDDSAAKFQSKPRKSTTETVANAVAKNTQDETGAVNASLSVGKIGKWGTINFTSMRNGPTTHYDYDSVEFDDVLKPNQFFKSKNLLLSSTSHDGVEASCAVTSFTQQNSHSTNSSERSAEEQPHVSKESPVKRFLTPAARKEYCYPDQNQLISSLSSVVAQATTAYQNLDQMNRESKATLSNLDILLTEARAHIRLYVFTFTYSYLVIPQFGNIHIYLVCNYRHETQTEYSKLETDVATQEIP